MESPLIALLTDFGTTDPFAGIVKGVITGIAPGVPLIDLTHDLLPGEIRRAAITLWQSAPYFPQGTIFLAVVDPGVGTSRKPVFVQTDLGQPGKEIFFIGPDNGLFTFVLAGNFQAWELANPAYRLPHPSATFHGRDIFAPAAAYAARGVRGPDFGPPVPDPVRLPAPRLVETGPGRVTGEILFADRFGNILTSLGRLERQASDLLQLRPWIGSARPRLFRRQAASLVLPNGVKLSLVDTFGHIPNGESAALAGSSGLLEIAANRRSAAEILNLKDGDPVILELVEESLGDKL
jgi:S-adenosylmethionine hydrolase